MPTRDIVVVGASAGGVEALIDLVRGLPADLPAAVFVVMHVPAYGVSRLPEILRRSGPLPAAHARDGETIVPGRIYVAPPDRHLLVRLGQIDLSRGPRENHSRPAIDPLFRTAARAYGPRVVGVILSGALYDGSAGLLAVKARGGLAIVQDPGEAAVDSMPRSALRLVEADHILSATAIGATLASLATVPAASDGGTMATTDDDELIAEVIEADFAAQAEDRRVDQETLYTCPDCGGVMWQADAGPALRFRCHVGHAYTPEVLLSQKSEELEAALWSCIRLLKERSTLSRQTARRVAVHSSERVDEQAQRDEEHAQILRELLESLPSLPLADAGSDEAFGHPGNGRDGG